MEPDSEFPSDFLLNSTPTTSSTNPAPSIPTAPFPSTSLPAILPIHTPYTHSPHSNPAPTSPFLTTPSPAHTASISADLQILSNKFPPSPPPHSNSTALLLHLLDRLTPRWVSDFLFTPDPTHIPSFSRPRPPNPLFLTNTTTRLHTPHLQTPFPPPGDHTTASVLLLPAFCIDTKTLGFGVAHGLELHRLNPNLAPIPNIPLFRKHLRFLHDSTTHTLLLVIDSPKEDTLLISSWSHPHLTSTRTISTRLHRGHFLSTIQQNHNIPSLPLLLSSLISVTDQALFCDCPRCGAAYMSGCGCQPEGRRARHAYDFAPFRESVCSALGAFSGSGFRYRGEEVGGFGVMSRLVEVADEGLVEQLAEWGLRKRAFRVEVDEEDGSFGMGGVRLESDWSGEQRGGENSRESVGRGQRHGEGNADGGEMGVEAREEEGEEKSPEEVARLRRARERRERNRLAARRSNRKKKQERDAKKAELELLKQQEEALRKREASLRREQALLKELVTAREDRMGRGQNGDRA